MNFTTYYANFIRAHGVPNLDLHNHKKLFNIISVENQLKIANDQTKLFHGSEFQRYNEMLKYRLKQKLSGLTQGRLPNIVMQILIEESKVN